MIGDLCHTSNYIQLVSAAMTAVPQGTMEEVVRTIFLRYKVHMRTTTSIGEEIVSELTYPFVSIISTFPSK